jgi:hypothetical protein
VVRRIGDRIFDMYMDGKLTEEQFQVQSKRAENALADATATLQAVVEEQGNAAMPRCRECRDAVGPVTAPSRVVAPRLRRGPPPRHIAACVCVRGLALVACHRAEGGAK